MIDAARRAAASAPTRRGAPACGPLNALLTVRWAPLLSNELNRLRAHPTCERIALLMDCIRHRLGRARIGFPYVWVREAPHGPDSEHWHLALHLPVGFAPTFVRYLETLLGEPAGPQRPASKRSEGEVACSDTGGWHLALDQRAGSGEHLAAYLGKGEPSLVTYRGRPVPNRRKPVRGIEHGGTEFRPDYDQPQGRILGTPSRDARFDIARHLKDPQRGRRPRASTVPRAVREPA